MKDETNSIAIEEFAGLSPKVHLFLIDDNCEYKKAKSVNKNVDATLIDNDYKHVLLNNKCLWHSVNRIESKHHKI